MNRLQIVQRLRQEAGVSGIGPATLTGIAGELKRLSDYADDAWLEIQGLTLWDWRWSRPQFNLAAGDSTVAAGLAARLFNKDSMRLRPSGARLDYLPWAEFIEAFPQQAQVGTPTAWTVQPDRALRFNAVAPVGGLVLDAEAYARAAALADDTAVPGMPAEHHMAIVWLALQKYAAFEEAGVLYQTAEREFNKIKRAMELDSTPEVTLGGALC